MHLLRQRLGDAATWLALLAAGVVVLVAGGMVAQGSSVADAEGATRTVPALGPALLSLVVFLPIPAALAFGDRPWMRWLAVPVAVAQTFLVFLTGLSIGGPQLWTSLPLVWAAALLRTVGDGGAPARPQRAGAERTA